MRNKIHNMVIYAHFVRNHFRTHFNGSPIKKDYDFNRFLDSGGEYYIKEKIRKYLGKNISIEEIDHNKILIVWFEKPRITSIQELTQYFTPFIDRITSANFIVPETELFDNSGKSVGLVDQFFSVYGADFTMNVEIQSYLNYCSEIVWVEILRDLKIIDIIE